MDPISDMIVIIKNAGMAGKPSAVFPHSKVKVEIANLLVREGYLKSVSVANDKRFGKRIEVDISYLPKGLKGKNSVTPKFSGIQRISKLSVRRYSGASDLTPVNQGYGISVISTNKGLMTDKEARAKKLGGEVLFKVW